MKHEALPEDDPEPDDVVLKNIGEVAMSEFERDTFLDGLSLGIWDEEFGYYKTKEEL